LVAADPGLALPLEMNLGLFIRLRERAGNIAEGKKEGGSKHDESEFGGARRI